MYDSPIPGAIDAIKELSKTYTLIIFTAKVKPDRPLINGKTGEQLIWDWLGKYNLNSYIYNHVNLQKKHQTLIKLYLK